MAVVENRFVCDLSKPVQAQALKGNVFSLDNLGSRLSVLIYNNGQPSTISGSVTANCILPDGSTVNVNGGLTTENGGSKAYVDVPQSCLLIPGILKIAIKCTSSSVITTLAAIVANVYMTKTDNVITPSQQIIADWNAEISASLANQDAEISDIKSALNVYQADVENTNGYNILGLYPIDDGSLWPHGYYNGSGTFVPDGKYRTPSFYLPDTIKRIYSTGDYEFAVVVFDRSGTFVTRYTSKTDFTTFYPDYYKYKINVHNTDNQSLDGRDWSPYINIINGEDLNATTSRIDGEVVNIRNNLLLSEDITLEYNSPGKYLRTKYFIGGEVSQTETSSSGWAYIRVPCKAGEKFVVSGRGGDNGRLWAFTDANNILYDLDSLYNETESSVTLTVKKDGYFISNVNTSYQYSLTYMYFCNNTYMDEVKKITGNGVSYKSIETPVYYKYITTNVDIGAIVDTTEVDGQGYAYKIFEVDKGDQFVITGHGANGPRLWAFTDENYKLISKAAQNAVLEDGLLTAPVDGYAIFDINISYRWSITKLTKATGSDAINKVINEDIPLLKNNSRNIPTVKLDVDYNLRNFTSEASTCDFNPETFMPDIYDLFDALATTNPDYVTKYDAALYDGLSMEYPVYANGVSAGDPTYLQTPAYKTYMYKLACESIAAGNQSYCPKQRVFIICGTHGNERFSTFVIYLMAKLLCNVSDPNYFKMRSAFDFYIIPVLSGYSSYHDKRQNANGVNLNRNFPTAGWKEAGSGTVNYTGATAGSEFETQLVMALTDKIQPSVLIDAHNYGISGERQFYAVVSEVGLIPLIYQCLVDCSCTFIKELPQYFGTKWQLFLENTAESSPRVMGKTTTSTTAQWAYEHGIKDSATLEIGESIKFLNGEYVDEWQDHYGTTSMAVGEYTYRRELVAMLQYALDKINT